MLMVMFIEQILSHVKVKLSLFEGILRPRFDRPSVRSFNKKCLPSVRSFTKKYLPSVRSFTKKCLPSVKQEKHLTGGYSKGSNRLTCTAQRSPATCPAQRSPATVAREETLLKRESLLPN